MKTSKIISCDFTNEAVTTYGVYYYHRISFENGDSGSIGCKNKLPSKIAVGSTLSYEINSEGKIKQIPITTEAQNIQKPTTNQPASQQPAAKTNQYAKRPEDFLGFCYGYAKDIVCARIAKQTAKKEIDFESEVILTARAFYEAIKEDLKNT